VGAQRLGRLDIVVACAAGAKPVEMAIQLVRTDGTIVAIGGSRFSHPANAGKLACDARPASILGYTTESWIHTLERLTSRKFQLGDLIMAEPSANSLRHSRWWNCVASRSATYCYVRLEFCMFFWDSAIQRAIF
jgi:hypothetical protein